MTDSSRVVRKTATPDEIEWLAWRWGRATLLAYAKWNAMCCDHCAAMWAYLR